MHLPDVPITLLPSITVATATSHSGTLYSKQPFFVNIAETYYPVY